MNGNAFPGKAGLHRANKHQGSAKTFKFGSEMLKTVFPASYLRPDAHVIRPIHDFLEFGKNSDPKIKLEMSRR